MPKTSLGDGSFTVSQLPREIADVLSGARRWTVQCGDSRELLRLLPDACIDACICDPPYELSNDLQAGAGRVFLELMFPEDANIKAEASGEDQLAFLVGKILGLRTVGVVPAPSAAVPITAMAFHGETSAGYYDVEHADVSSDGIADRDRRADLELERSEHLGDFFLECADAAAVLNALNSAGCGFDSGTVGVGFAVPTSRFPGFEASGSIVDHGNSPIGTRDDALAACVRALGRTEDLTVARVSLGRSPVDRLSASSALMLCAVFLQAGAKLVRAAARTRRLPSKFESRAIRMIDHSTGRTLTLNLIVHPLNIASKGFMGKDWDGSKIAFDVALWREVYRVLKPGGLVASFGGTRTYHRMACAIEDAGFIVRDQLDWLYGEGMPKGTNISKAIDRRAGAVRRVVGQQTLTGNAAQTTKEKGGTYASGTDSRGVPPKVVDITAPATEAAQQWEGWGTGLKPGHEPIALAMKPLEGTFDKNVIAHGTGALHVDACRIEAAEDYEAKCASVVGCDSNRSGNCFGDWPGKRADSTSRLGRWPANIILSHAEGCIKTGTRKVKAAPAWNDNRPDSLFTGAETSPVHHSGGDGMETIDAWECVDGCPAKRLDEQSGDDFGRTGRASTGMGFNGGDASREQPRHNDEGGASRYFTQFEYEPFFYEPKASGAERERGCEWMPEETVDDGRKKVNDTPYQRGKTARRNIHPTVKPVAVVRWLSRLLCRYGGIILDPFGGSGTGGIAAMVEGMRWIGFDIKPKHCEIARARIIGDSPLFNREAGA